MALHEVGHYETVVGNIVISSHVPEDEAFGEPYPAKAALWIARRILPHLQGPSSYSVSHLAHRIASKPGFYVASLVGAPGRAGDMAPDPLAFAEVSAEHSILELGQLGVTWRQPALPPRYYEAAAVVLDFLLSRRPPESLCVVKGYDGDTRTEGNLHEMGFITSPGAPEWGQPGSVLIASCKGVLDTLEMETSFRTGLPESLDVDWLNTIRPDPDQPDPVP